MNRIACSAVVSVLSGVALGAAEVRPAAKAPQVRVMTYNVRYSAGDKKSPDNNWKARRDDFARTVERENPDVVGFQEVLPDQRKWLERRFPDYAFTGEGRNADRVNGEASPVAFRRDRFEAVTNGTFWLSKTPDVPGSKSWNAAFPRICTYAVLKDKATGKTFSFANTHTDHKSEEAREKGMLLIIERMKDFGRGAPIVFVGDHNCLEYTGEVRVEAAHRRHLPFQDAAAGLVADVQLLALVREGALDRGGAQEADRPEKHSGRQVRHEAHRLHLRLARYDGAGLPHGLRHAPRHEALSKRPLPVRRNARAGALAGERGHVHA